MRKSFPSMSAFGGHLPAGPARKKRDAPGGWRRKVRQAAAAMSVPAMSATGRALQATESMNFASATSLSESPPASWVESTISTLL